jgi:hypothetical protein
MYYQTRSGVNVNMGSQPIEKISMARKKRTTEDLFREIRASGVWGEFAEKLNADRRQQRILSEIADQLVFMDQPETNERTRLLREAAKLLFQIQRMPDE